jgi:hypothetical protein
LVNRELPRPNRKNDLAENSQIQDVWTVITLI